MFLALTEYAGKQPGWTIAPDNHEGIRVNLDRSHGGGWFLLRMSLHDPLMPLNIESDQAGGVRQIAAELYEYLRGFRDLDTDKLKEFLA